MQFFAAEAVQAPTDKTVCLVIISGINTHMMRWTTANVVTNANSSAVPHPIAPGQVVLSASTKPAPWLILAAWAHVPTIIISGKFGDLITEV
jgi:hypothetical protein